MRQPPSQPEVPEGRSRIPARLLLLGAVLAIAWFYRWTVDPVAPYEFTGDARASYNNLLVRGLLKGQLSLDLPPDPFMESLANPYDPVARGNHGMHDASYFQGKYYIYFGITPVVLLYLPFHLLTGSYLGDHAAVLCFALAGFLLSCGLLRSVIRDCFPRTTALMTLACVVALGLANMVPPLLRRPSMWEVPIACAYALFMLTLFCVWKALARKEADWRWMLGASLAMGLCIGARTVYLPGAVVLLVPLGQAAVQAGRAFLWDRRWRRLAAAALLPIMAVGAALAAYNHSRFGNPFEFGQSYQLSGAEEGKLEHLSLRYVPFNLRVYLFSTPGLSPYFPFLTVISPPAKPPGQFGMENPYGTLPGMPWVLFAGAAAWLAWKKRGRLGWWCLGALAGTILTFGMLTLFGGSTGRYQVDFTPGLVFVAAVGAAWSAAEWERSRWGRPLVGLAVVLAVWSAGFNILVSFQHNRLLEQNYPAVYARTAQAFNHLPHWLARLSGHQDGPVELRVIFPEDRRGRVEPLVVTGREFLSDYLFVHYLEPGLLRFGYEHTSRGSWTGPSVRVTPGAEHSVVVQMGSLYPPEAHPAHTGLSPEELAARRRTVRVHLDGRTVLRVEAESYDPTDWQPAIGASGPHRPGFKEDFSGRVLGWKRVSPPAPAPGEPGLLRLLVRLPPFTQPRNEPLLSTGRAGAGDLVYIRYVDATHFQIGHDRWGYGGGMGPLISYNPDEPLDFDISCPPLLGNRSGAGLVVTLNGQALLKLDESFHPSRAEEIVVGVNAIGASTAEAAFTGVVELQERIPE